MSHAFITCEAAINFARPMGSVARPNLRGRTMSAALKLVVEEHHHRGRRIRLVVPSDNDRHTRRDHFDEFLSAMMEHAAGDVMTPHRIHQSYTDLARASGWPPITEIRLTKALVARGCRKRVLDLRSGEANRRDRLRKYSGKLRPVVIEFPEEDRPNDAATSSSAPDPSVPARRADAAQDSHTATGCDCLPSPVHREPPARRDRAGWIWGAFSSLWACRRL